MLMQWASVGHHKFDMMALNSIREGTFITWGWGCGLFLDLHGGGSYFFLTQMGGGVILFFDKDGGGVIIFFRLKFI